MSFLLFSKIKYVVELCSTMHVLYSLFASKFILITILTQTQAKRALTSTNISKYHITT